MAEQIKRCWKCRVKDGEVGYYPESGRAYRVQLVNSKYGPLCQRCAHIEYNRACEHKKQSARALQRIEEERRLAEEAGQLSMFDFMESKDNDQR